jgi:hypothetical protein
MRRKSAGPARVLSIGVMGAAGAAAEGVPRTEAVVVEVEELLVDMDEV